MASAVAGEADVIVIGGGPGGSTAASMLARQGVRVVLLERERFPRAHVGESLLPATLPILEELGVLEAVRAEGFVEKYGATMVWGRDREPWSWYFRETNATWPHAWQVWRPRFDELLLDNARGLGVDVRTEHTVREVDLVEGRAVGVRCIDAAGSPQALRARLVVDASGQSALLARRLRLRRWDPFFRNLAVYAYYSGAERLPTPDEGNIFIESTEDGWIWLIPLHGDRTSVGAVLDRDAAKARLVGRPLADLLREQLERAPRARAMLAGARLEDGPHAVKDWSYRARRLVGPGWVLVGDAACFVDPLFSSGVHLAMSSGVLAAAYVASALRDSEIEPEAARAYSAMYGTQYEHFHTLARLFYTSNRTVESYFWEARRLLGDDAGFSPREAFVRAVAGQPPAGYERAVLERGELPPSFARGVRHVEAERARRRAQLDGAGNALASAAPRLAAGVRVERKAVLGRGAFGWGRVIVADDRDDVPCSPIVAGLVSLADGERTIAEIAGRLAPGERAASPLEPTLCRAAGILYVDGLIEGFAGL